MSSIILLYLILKKKTDCCTQSSERYTTLKRKECTKIKRIQILRLVLSSYKLDVQHGYCNKLQYPVNIKNPNPKLAKIIISQLGGL